MRVKVEVIVNVPEGVDVEEYLNDAEFSAVSSDGTDIYDEVRDYIPIE